MRMTAKVICFAVLEYEPAALFEQTAALVATAEDQIRNLCQSLQRVGWVGIDKVVLHAAGADELKHIATYHAQIAYAELLTRADDEVLLYVCQFDARYLSRAATDKLDTDTACTGKEVQHIRPLKIHTIIEQIEEALLGKVCCGPCGDIFRGRQSPPPISS